MRHISMIEIPGNFPARNSSEILWTTTMLIVLQLDYDDVWSETGLLASFT